LRPPEKILAKGLEALGLRPPEGAVEKFLAYLGEIRKWRKAAGLTSLRTDEDIVVRHFLDSCLYLAVLGPGIESVADVGSGAGLPGIPIKIMRPGLKVFLVEPGRKKCAFLRHAKRTLSLEDVTVVEKRVEEAEGITVDAAVTRALFKAGELAEKAAHIVRPGGIFVLSKGPRVREELAGLALPYTVHEIPLPMGDAVRYLVVIRAAPRH